MSKISESIAKKHFLNETPEGSELTELLLQKILNNLSKISTEQEKATKKLSIISGIMIFSLVCSAISVIIALVTAL